MKLALAMVAALSLAACVDEPSDPGEGLYGVGIGKNIRTDPAQLVSRDKQPSARLNVGLDEALTQADWLEDLTGEQWEQVCKGCDLVGVHLRDAEVHDVLVFDGAGKYIGYVPLAEK